MPPLSYLWRWLSADPRHGQIATLALLLAYGLGRLGFDLPIAQAVVTIGAALLIQAIADSVTGQPPSSGAKSALISSLSLCLLLRTDNLLLAIGAATIAPLPEPDAALPWWQRLWGRGR